MKNRTNQSTKPAPGTIRAKTKPKAKEALSVKRLWLFGSGIIILIAFAVWFIVDNGQDGKISTAPSALSRSDTGATERPRIQTIRLTPGQATKMDTLEAEVTTITPDPKRRITYSYIWKVNNRVVEGVAGNTLNLANFKKRDLITVTVTPHDGSVAGFPVESPVIAIHSAAPTLELKVLAEKRKIGEPLELQLGCHDPDDDKVTY
ncbi:MAG: hypothetical protein PHN75_01350, partial [Syntrophales bacterium]|nr:hypothetical protein [Syntrophales bacterium]